MVFTVPILKPPLKTLQTPVYTPKQFVPPLTVKPSPFLIPSPTPMIPQPPSQSSVPSVPQPTTEYVPYPVLPPTTVYQQPSPQLDYQRHGYVNGYLTGLNTESLLLVGGVVGIVLLYMLLKK